VLDRVGRRSALGADRGQKDEALGASSPRGAGEANRRLSVEHPVVILWNAGHRLREPSRMDHCIHSLQRGRHILRSGEIANHRARGLHRHRGWPAQQHSQAVAARRQFPQ